jgi:hypothetical protein
MLQGPMEATQGPGHRVREARRPAFNRLDLFLDSADPADRKIQCIKNLARVRRDRPIPLIPSVAQRSRGTSVQRGAPRLRASRSSCERSPSMRKCSDFLGGLSAVRFGIRSAPAQRGGVEGPSTPGLWPSPSKVTDFRHPVSATRFSRARATACRARPPGPEGTRLRLQSRLKRLSKMGPTECRRVPLFAG